MKNLSILFLCILAAMQLPAQQPGTVQRSEIIEELEGKEYYIHLVRYGENLQNIAAAYQVSTNVISNENPKLKGVVNTGDVIKIPKARSVAQPKVAETETIKPATPDAARGSKTHTVEAGQTFFGIARQYDVSVAALRAANIDIEALQPGQVLQIPTKKDQTQTSTSPSADQPPRQAEPAKHDEIPETYDVQAGETLFSISRKFGLEVDELISLNPELKNGLKAGQTLRFKKKENNESSRQIIIQDTTISYTYHRVRRGETLYSLSRQYGVSLENLLENNPHVIEGLQPRQVLKIPVYKITTRRIVREIIPEEPVDIPVDTIPAPRIEPDDCLPHYAEMEKIYNIALLLPFFLDAQENDVLNDTVHTTSEVNPYRSFSFMQFYYGVLLAFDSLQKQGLNARLYVYDVDHTSESLTKVLAAPELPEMDLIIGPLYANSFDQVSRFAKNHNINIINPLSQRNEFLLNNPYAFKAQPSVKKQVDFIVSYLKEHLADRNIVVVRQFSFSETGTLQLFKDELNESTVHDVIYIRDSLDGILRYLDKDRENIIVGLSTDKVFSMDLIRKLNDIRSEYDIICFGLNEWEYFLLDTDHIVNLQLHLPSTDFIDYDAEPVKKFIHSYRSKYDVEPLPERFAFAAYDITYYFGSALMKYGKAFNDCLPFYQHRGLQLPFEFESTVYHGLENTGLTLFKIQDYKKVEIAAD
jgi:LysM repeat protein